MSDETKKPVDALLGSAGYRGPRRTLKEMEAGIAASARDRLDHLAERTQTPKELGQDAIEALGRVGFDPHTELHLGPVVKRAAEEREMLRTCWSCSEAARILGSTEDRIRQRLGERSLYGFQRGEAWLLPAFQFTSEGLVPQIERVLVRLRPELEPLSVVGWFTRAHVDLETDDGRLSPVEWLRAGYPWEPLAELAEDL